VKGEVPRQRDEGKRKESDGAIPAGGVFQAKGSISRGAEPTFSPARQPDIPHVLGAVQLRHYFCRRRKL